MLPVFLFGQEFNSHRHLQTQVLKTFTWKKCLVDKMLININQNVLLRVVYVVNCTIPNTLGKTTYYKIWFSRQVGLSQNDFMSNEFCKHYSEACLVQARLRIFCKKDLGFSCKSIVPYQLVISVVRVGYVCIHTYYIVLYQAAIFLLLEHTAPLLHRILLVSISAYSHPIAI